MNDKEVIQDKELQQVAGGTYDHLLTCEKCGGRYNGRENYPNGWIVSTGSFCHPVYHYKCPGCGYEFTVKL